MPSKKKSNSKTQSRLFSTDRSASPCTPSLKLPQDFEASEDDFLGLLEDASIKYPTLVGKSSFIGRVTDTESKSKGCNIWLSEPSMVTHSLSPGSIVSVSVASKMTRFLDITHSSQADGCSTDLDGKVGSYFALATVFPSCKVLKDGVRLSLNLSYTMGCPATGTVVFVYPVKNQTVSGSLYKCDKPHDTSANCLSLRKCNKLYLELASSENKLATINSISSPINVPAEKMHNQYKNGMDSPPKTPLFHSKLGSFSTCQSASPKCEETVASLTNKKSSSFSQIAITEILRDENAKKLMQICATSWLYSRNLLYGNLVAIPILSELCFFHVSSAKKLSLDSADLDQIDVNRHDLSPQVFEELDNEKDAFVVGSETKIYLSLGLDLESKNPQRSGLPFLELGCKDAKPVLGSDNYKLGGLFNEIAVLKDIISSVMNDTLSSYGLRTIKGVLLHGPPGTGKTTLARMCAREAGVNLFSIDGPEIVGQYYGESEKALKEVFDAARQASPSVIFIDELDAIAPARKDGVEELSQRMVATLLDLMDGINRTNGLLVIAATNRPDSIEPALRRPGRLDREIEIGVPSPKQRLDILLSILSEMEHSLLGNQIEFLAMSTHGYVGADLASLGNEAALICLRRYVKSEKSFDGLHSWKLTSPGKECSDGNSEGSDDLAKDILSDYSDSASSSVSKENFSENQDSTQNHINLSSENAYPVEDDCKLKVTFEDFEKARLKVRPSAMREVLLEVPKVNWADVGGQNEVKAQLMEAVEWPQKHQDAFKQIGIRPPIGVLLFGPPGCSKTLMARAVASESGLNFLAVKGPELFSKWVGESEKAVRSLFTKARANAPSIIFFDEIDALAVIRGKDGDGLTVSDRVMSQLLVELDGLHQRVDVTVIAATNRPDKIDSALLRPGRFDRLIYVGPPNELDREDIFRIHLRKTPCNSDVSIRDLARLSEGCTGADISSICREAAVAALEENLDATEIRMEHLKTAIRRVQPSNSQFNEEILTKFQRFVQSGSAKR